MTRFALALFTLLFAAPVLSPAVAQVSGGAFSGFSSNSDDPIAIDADELEVVDSEAKAVFSGNVKVRQGASLITTGKLTVFYVKGPEGDDAGAAQNNIDRLVLTGGLVATSDNNTATADSGIYSVVTDNVTLEGNVVVSQGESVAKGCKLTANLKTNVARLKSCGGRVQSVFKPGAQ